MTAACPWALRASSCKTFEACAFSTVAKWIVPYKLGIDEFLHLLDYFLFIASTNSHCRGHLDGFLTLCAELGIPIASEKTCGPATTLVFAGISS
jgi:hypothetical protein